MIALISWLKDLAEQLGLTDSQWTALTGYATVLGVVAAVFAAVVAAVALFTQIQPILREAKKKKALRDSELSSVYQIEEMRAAVEYYIEPDCTPLDPATEEDLRQIVPVRSSLFKTLDDYLRQGNLRKYVLLLADSGMGKTAFLLNYFVRNQLDHPEKNHSICLIPLNADNVESKIARLKDSKNTGIDPKHITVLLDAFDEDPVAQAGYRQRLVSLMKSCDQFKNVVVTCRTQFFSSDEEIPKDPGVAVFGPLGAADSGQYKFHKLYIAPFSDVQISAYVKRRFPFWRITHRRQAMEIVGTVSELSVRPMLLVAIPEIVKGKIDAEHLINLYEFLVEGWLERERKIGIKPEELRPFSEFLAFYIYLNRSRKDKPERLSRQELREKKERYSFDVENWKFEQRSFLNRDAGGNLKFAHRSIMEYLFITGFFAGEVGCLRGEWTDLMKHLFFSYVAAKNAALGTLEKFEAVRFEKTKLFPCLTFSKRSDTTKSDVDYLTGALSLKVAAGIPTQALQEVIQACLVMRDWLVTEVVIDDMTCISSYALNLTWHIVVDPRTPDEESYKLFSLDRYGPANDIQIPSKTPLEERKRSRYPSVQEFDFMWQFSKGDFLGKDWLYWSSTSTEGKESVLVSFGAAPLNIDSLKYLGPKKRFSKKTPDGVNMHVYALKKEPLQRRDALLRAIPIWVHA